MKLQKSSLKRPLNPMPDFVRRALLEQGLMEAYHRRPPYQQNDYLGWIARAKLKATQEKRLTQMLEELARGEGYMNMPYRAKMENKSGQLLPEDLAKRLEKDADLLAAWEKLRPSCQRDYLALIEAAPDAAARKAKLTQVLKLTQEYAAKHPNKYQNRKKT
jgi:uncharacterized protein YdeI (YjbR/CyaY-like superfamily)